MGTLFFFRFYFLNLEKGEGREKEGEKHRSVASCTHSNPWIKPTTQACTLTGNRTSDLSLCRMMPSQLSHTGQGEMSFHFLVNKWFVVLVHNIVPPVQAVRDCSRDERFTVASVA